MAIKKWLRPKTEQGAWQRLAEEQGLPKLLAKVLLARGIDTPEKVEAFLHPAQVSDPYLFKDMDKAVERIQQAVEAGEQIRVYGDYDADGVTSTAILTSYLESMGADVKPFIPSRDGEGYGLARSAVQQLAEEGVSLIITVDNGISANEEIAFASSLGVDVVVTDHHMPGAELPPAVAVVDPHRQDETAPFRDYAGVGVAYLLLCALEGDEATIAEMYADIAAIGTVADVVPLQGENRSLVQKGLDALQNTMHPGLASLIAVAGLEEKTVTSQHVAFGLAPRINAAGRVGSADVALSLLLCEEEEEAAALAAQVNDCNLLRQKMEGEILKEIEALIARRPELLEDPVLVLAGENWHHGIIGIVASRMVERFLKPCILIGIEGGEGRGSGRSVPGFSLFEAVSAAKETLLKCGGHPMAVGLSIAAGQVDAFRKAINAYARMQFAVMPVPTLQLDAILEPEDLTLENVQALSALEPVGGENPAPLFLLEGAEVAGLTAIGGGKHLRARLRLGGKEYACVCFGKTPETVGCALGDRVDAAVTLDENEYNGIKSVSIKIKEIRPAGFQDERAEEELLAFLSLQKGVALPEELAKRALPSRGEFALVYRYLKEQKTVQAEPMGLGLTFAAQGLGVLKLQSILAILEEKSLIARQRVGQEDYYMVLPATGKADLESARLYQKIKENMGVM